ncbi:MAG TPA: c-type cytochrome domain-containing protein [Terriglobales bacterium]|nr:c-type cytochrome domain-containing protein [Terriglobales bacterium]
MSVTAKVAGRLRELWQNHCQDRLLLLSSAALGVLMLLALLFFPLDGRAHADWLQFFGRFHPLLVHLPIGLIVLLPLLEVMGTRRSSLREAAGVVLYIALATCLISLLFGLLLAYGSGESGTTVTRHMRGAIVLALELLFCVAVRGTLLERNHSRAYFVLLTAVLLTLAWTAHQGGSLTHGGGYLTRYMPPPLKRIVAPSAVSSHPNSFFAKHIYPALDTKCVACHGTNKEQGGLRLDSYESLMAGGKDGIVIAPRNPDGSVLLKKVTLPPSDPHFMPAEGRTPLTPDEIARIRAWVLAGASPEAPSIPGIFIAGDREEPPPPVGDYSALMGEIRQMQQSQGAKLVPVSAKPSDGLILRTTDIAASFDDTQLAKFQRFAPFIVDAELGRTALTDSSVDTLVQFKNVRAIHLEDTALTGRNLGKLTSLSQLTYLNLSATKVTSDALAPLKSMPNLSHLYLFNTPAEAASPDGGLRSTQ